MAFDPAAAIKEMLDDAIDKRADLQAIANEHRDPMDRLKFEIYDHVVYRMRAQFSVYFPMMFPERKDELCDLARKYRSRHHPDFTG